MVARRVKRSAAESASIQRNDRHARAVAKTGARRDAKKRVGTAQSIECVRFLAADRREFFVADAYWLPPDGTPIGPMALEVICDLQRPQNPQITLVKVTQRASEDGE